MAAGHSVFDQVDTQGEFGGRILVFFINERGITAELPQLGKLGKNLYLTGLKFFLCLLVQHHADSLNVGVIELLLFPFHIGIHAFFQFVRQIGEDVFFQPPQDKRSDHFMKSVHGSFILILHSGYFDFRPEALVSVQKPWHEIVKNTPKFTEPVFNGSAGESKATFGFY